MVTGTPDFPWADKIVFNAVPILDVNFINPNAKSMLANDAISKVISRTYATIFTLCTTFFSLAVMIMAIKLATTVIAAEKAKYKQAIWDWIVGLVLLFTIHIVISFTFYLNETLVVVASDIARENIDQNAKQAKARRDENVQEFIDSAKSEIPALGTRLEETPGLAEAWLKLDPKHGLKPTVINKDGFLGIDYNPRCT